MPHKDKCPFCGRKDYLYGVTPYPGATSVIWKCKDCCSKVMTVIFLRPEDLRSKYVSDDTA